MRSHIIVPCILLLLGGLVLSGCGGKLPSIKPYKMEIQQGNVVTSKMLLQLRPGMNKSQVRYIMGTPLIVDSFHDNRWDYFYALRQEGKVIEKRRVILDFQNDALVSVRGDVVAANDKTAEAPVNTAPRSVSPVKPPETKSWWQRLKFWGGDEEEAGKAVAATSDAQVENPAVIPDSASSAGEIQSAMSKQDVPLKTDGSNPKDSLIATESASFVSDQPTPESTPSILRKEIELPLSPSPAAPPVQPLAESSEAEVRAIPTEPIVARPVEASPPETTSSDKAADRLGDEKPSSSPADNASVVALGAAKEKTAISENHTTSEPDEAKLRAEVENALLDWAQAWRQKDLKRYLAAYTGDYKGDGMPTHQTWVAQRKSRIANRKGGIELSLEDVNIQVQQHQATVMFFQKYRSAVYSDESAKRLTFNKDSASGRWLIVKEEVLTDGARPVVRKIIAPEQTEEHLEGVIERIGF